MCCVTVIEIFLAFGLIAPGFALLRISRIRIDSLREQIIYSYLLSLALLFFVLYLSGILMQFVVGAYIYTMIVVISLIFMCALIFKNYRSGKAVRDYIPTIQPDMRIVWIVGGCLLAIFFATLLSRAIIDSDVIDYYLPFAREIVRSNGFSYATGYDYSIHLKPIGSSVLYAWTYVVSGSLHLESFRLLPIVPELVMILLSYSIVVEATKRRDIAILATIIFMLMMPLQDRFLLNNAFYPDIFYYPLISFVLLASFKYLKTRDSRLLFLIGISFGVALLLKAQTIMFILVFVLLLAIIEIGSKKVLFLLCFVAPFAILVPNVLAEFSQVGGFSSLSMQLGTIPLLLFAAIILSFSFIILNPRSSIDYHEETLLTTKKQSIYENLNQFRIEFQTLVRKLLYVIIPVAAFAGLWYVNNLVRFGSLIYTSSTDIPNIDWAIAVINSILQTNEIVDFVYYIPFFFFLFIHPAVMGYVWLIPLLFGFLYLIKQRMNHVSFMLFYGIAAVVLIYAQVVYSINPYLTITVNPRDLLNIAPILATIAAVAVRQITVIPDKRNEETSLFVPLLLIAYFSTISYIHCGYMNLAFGYVHLAISGMLRLFGLTIPQTSFSIGRVDQVLFVSTFTLEFLILSVAVALPFILLIVRYMKSRYSLSRTSFSPLYTSIITKQDTLNLASPFSNYRKMTLKNGVIITMLLVTLLTLPHAIIFSAQGNKNVQIDNYYGKFSDLLTPPDSEIQGGILTYLPPAGLQYYLSNAMIINLREPANLAYLRNCFRYETPREITVSLQEHGINYLLLNPDATNLIDGVLNQSLTSIVKDYQSSRIVKSYGQWRLYSLGSYESNTTVLPTEGWDLHTYYSIGSYSYQSNESAIFLGLTQGLSQDRVTLVTYELPSLILDDYTYLYVNMTASSNALILLRFGLENGILLDLSYWNTGQSFEFPVDLSHINGTLNGLGFIALISSDGLPASVTINNMMFIQYW